MAGPLEAARNQEIRGKCFLRHGARDIGIPGSPDRPAYQCPSIFAKILATYASVSRIFGTLWAFFTRVRPAL